MPNQEKVPYLLFFIIVLLGCSTQFAADLYAPCIVSIADELGTSINNVQYSMSIYMLGIALSQLIYGPLSEGLGRKKTIIIGLSIMCIGILVCMFATNIETIILGRLIQGIGGGAPASLWRTMFRDLFSGEDLAKYTSYLVIFIMFIIPGAPLLGGYLEEFFGWNANFVFMLLYAILCLFSAIFILHETNKDHHISNLNFGKFYKNYKQMLTSRLFMCTSFSVFLSYGALFSWFIVGPVLLIDIIGMKPSEFGWVNFLGALGTYSSASYINGKLVKKLGIETMMRFAFSLMIISGILMSIGHAFFGINIYAIMIPTYLFFFSSSFIWPNAYAKAFTPFGKIAGYAGPLYRFMQIGGGAVLGSILAYLPENNQLSIGYVIIICSCLAFTSFELSGKE